VTKEAEYVLRHMAADITCDAMYNNVEEDKSIDFC
jgi:hypothetical protein